MVGDPEEYAAQVESRCAAGSARDCTSLGVHYAYGTYGRTQDYTQSRVYLEKACDGGDAQGCHELGVLCMYGRGLEADHARAQAIFAESCAGGVSSSCRDMGDYFSTGRGGTPKDPAQARQWYQRACDAGDEGSCDQARN